MVAWLLLCAFLVGLVVPAQARNLHRERVLPRFLLATLVEQAGGVLALDASDTLSLATDGAAAFLTANAQRLSIADNASLSFGDENFCLAGFVFLNSASVGGEGLVRKNPGGAVSEYAFTLDGGGASQRYRWVVGATGDVSADALGIPTKETWTHIVLCNDADADVVTILVNATLLNSDPTTSGPSDGTNAFTIGARSDGTFTMDGRMAQWAVWRRILIPAEITYLFNTGSGRTCAEHAALLGLLTNEEACWDLIESDGPRVDSVGSNNLSATNSPGTDAGPDFPRVLDGAALITWADTSGQGNDATQATQLIKPTWVQDCQNGRGCVRFDGVDDFMALVSRSDAAFTAMFVLRRQSTGAPHTLVGQGVTSDVLGFDSLDAYEVSDGTLKVTFGANASLAVQLLTYQHQDAVLNQVVRNGTLDATGGTNATVVRDQLGQRIATDNWNGDIAAVLWFPSLLDVAGRERIERCLMERYGIVQNTGACR